MSVVIKESELPQELTPAGVVEAAYTTELAEVASKLQRALPALVECDKDLAPYVFQNVRNRLRPAGLNCLYLDGRPREEQQQGGMMPQGMIGTMISQLREAVRGAVERRVVVLPHLDLLTTSQGGLTAEAREVIPLLYENPEIVWLGFKDPSFPLPTVIENLFPHRVSLLGIRRDRLRHLVTRRESRKFGREFNPWALYKYVSGVNAVRLRKLLSTLEGEDYPANPQNAYRQLRQATLGGTMEIPAVSLKGDIGGYAKVKDRLGAEILDVIARKEQLTAEEQIKAIEELIPKGMIFWGPPGTGKTLFAKAMASEIGAAVTVVSGPELKSKWVGESLPWDEEVPVFINGQSRRLPVGQIVEQHSTDDVLVWTADDCGRTSLAPVTGFLRHKAPDYVDVLVTESGRQVRVTGGHSLFVQREDGRLGEVFAEQVEQGKTRIAVPLFLPAPQTEKALDLTSLLGDRDDVRVAECAADAAVLGKRKAKTLKEFRASASPPNPGAVSLYCKHRSRRLPALMALTPDLAEFLGWWTAEGEYNHSAVRLTVNTAEAERVSGLCRRLFGRVRCYPHPERDSTVVHVGSVLLARLMLDGLSMPSGSRNKRVPPVIFNAPLPVVAAFLRGYFSGDGYFSGKYIEASTVSRLLASDIMTLLQYFGIGARLREKRERTGSVSRRVRFVWTEYLRRFVERIGFADESVNNRVCEYVDGIRLRRHLQTPAVHTANDILWELVVEKRREPYARPYVYDLSVAGTERFVAGSGNVLVHNSEDNLRQIFHRARQSAPSIIVFDELDSFASARGTYTGSGVEHSMVNQLLTEMDGFHREEMVFVVGTTNFVEALDPALLRPGRFEFHLHIPYPDDEARREILRIYDRKMGLKMTEETLEHAVRRTDFVVPGAAAGTLFSGDHLNALCRAIARRRLRAGRADATTPDDVEAALTEWVDKQKLTPAEERVVATHEAGHAVLALAFNRPIVRIALADDVIGALGYVRHSEKELDRKVQTRAQMLEEICICLGGRESELLLLGDLYDGATQDLHQATLIARYMVEVLGLGGEEIGPVRYRALDNKPHRQPDLSPAQQEQLDRRVREIIEEQRQRAATILRERQALVVSLRDLLVEKKVIEAKTLKAMVAGGEGTDGEDKKSRARSDGRRAAGAP
jgi:ATP-dependent Zn protease